MGQVVTAGIDGHEIRQIFAGPSEGVSPVESDRTIAGADEAALETHGAASLDVRGPTVAAARAQARPVA